MLRGSKPLPFTTIGEAFYPGAREWIRRVCGLAGFTLTISYEVGRALAIIHSCYESTIISAILAVTPLPFTIRHITQTTAEKYLQHSVQTSEVILTKRSRCPELRVAHSDLMGMSTRTGTS